MDYGSNRHPKRHKSTIKAPLIPDTLHYTTITTPTPPPTHTHSPTVFKYHTHKHTLHVRFFAVHTTPMGSHWVPSSNADAHTSNLLVLRASIMILETCRDAKDGHVRCQSGVLKTLTLVATYRCGRVLFCVLRVLTDGRVGVSVSYRGVMVCIRKGPMDPYMNE